MVDHGAWSQFGHTLGLPHDTRATPTRNTQQARAGRIQEWKAGELEAFAQYNLGFDLKLCLIFTSCFSKVL